MQTTEKWHRWQPIQDIAHTCYLNSLVNDNQNGFSMLLHEHNVPHEKMIKIDFSHAVEFYRKITEEFRIELYKKLNEKFPELSYGDWSFFKVENSEYLKSKTKIARLHHFCFMFDDFIIDVVASKEPTIIIINKES